MTSTIAHLHSLHPHIITTIPNTGPPTTDLVCELDIIYRLPPSVFVDRYQLNDILSSFHVEGGYDLEAPLEHVDPQGTWMIIRPSSSSRSVDLPVHLRYQVADPQLTHRSISVPSPKVGWSCQSQHPPSLLSALHHHSKTPHLTWIPLSSAPHTLLLTVPVGNTKDAAIVQWGTLVMIVLGTAWILHAIGYAIRKHRRHLVKGKRRKSE